MNKISELPDHYTPLYEPYFSGKGNHSVNELEELCIRYKEYAHQSNVRIAYLRKQNAEYIEALDKLKFQNSELLSALETLVHKCLHSDGYSQKVDELYQAQQIINLVKK